MRAAVALRMRWLVVYSTTILNVNVVKTSAKRNVQIAVAETAAFTATAHRATRKDAYTDEHAFEFELR